MKWKIVEGGAGAKAWKAWDSIDENNGNYRIVDCSAIRPDKPYRLISFLHEDEEGNPKFWDFASLQQAQDYTDMI